MTSTQHTLLASHQLAHILFTGIISDLDDRIAEKELPGATISRIAPIVAHAVLGEDLTVNTRLFGRPTLLEKDGWMERTGIPGPLPAMQPEWLAASFGLDALRPYAAEVFATTERALGELPNGALDARVTSPIGTEVTGAELLSSFNLLHLMLHAGEIAALKGVQGIPGGLPF